MNTTEFLASVKRGISVPANQNRFSDTDILALADEETQTKLLPVLISMRQEFLVRRDSVAIVSGEDRYPIPERAIGRSLRNVVFIQGGNTRQQLSYIAPDNSDYYTNYGNSTGTPSGFYCEGDDYILVPIPTSGTLEIKYEVQCSALTGVENAGLITAVNTIGDFITLSSVPASITIGATVDFVKGRPGNTIIAMDAVVTNVSGNDVFFTSLPSTLVVGDWVSPARTTPVIQLPQEMHQVLAQAVECRILEGLGDFEGMQASAQKLVEKTAAMLSLLSPRIKGENQKIVNFNGLLNRSGNIGSRRRAFGMRS